MRNARIRTGAALVFLAVGAACSDDDAAEPAAEARTDAPTTLAADASAGDVDEDAPPTEQTPTEPSTMPAIAPVEFTACVNGGPEVQAGTEQLSQISLPDGQMTITRGSGYTWQSTVRDVSDSRLDGTWYNSFDSDQYTSPAAGAVPDLEFGTWTHRIENDDGAWQGSGVTIRFADGESLDGPLVLLGEGAYEGLTAIGIIGFGEAPCPNTRGYIIAGGVPAPPVPQTGQ